jgi:FSR family fosmidomycin resistance protein-like MFS transporter
MNFIPTLLPFLIASYGFSISRGSFLVSAFTITSSIMQPVFGYLVDMKNKRWLVYVGTAWMGFILALIGIIPNYFVMAAAAVLAGLGTAAFHPQASAMVSAVSGERKGFWQSLFIAFGNAGWAFTPLLVVPYVHYFGLAKTPALALPGLIAAALLFFLAPQVKSTVIAKPQSLRLLLGPVAVPLASTILAVTLRMLTYFGLITFLPLYLQEKNISLLTSSRLLFIMLLSGALGGVIGGYLSDIWDRRVVTAGSLLLATPFFYLFLQNTGPVSWIFLVFAGAALLASFSVTVVAAQEILGCNAAFAAGLILGFGVGVGGLGVGLAGVLAEHFGLAWSIHFLISVPLAAGLAALGMPGKQT